MNTGSLRRRVTLTTLVLLAIVLAVVATATTLAYRAKLNSDLRTRMTNAAAAVERAGSGAALKAFVSGLSLQGIDLHAKAKATPKRAAGAAHATTPTGAAPTIHTRGSLLVLHETLRDGTPVTFSASHASIDRAVNNLLLVELAVAAAALALATALVLHGTRAALRPLSAVIETAARIAQGDSKLRLKPSRTNTELGRLAQAFDQMVDALEAAVEEARASDAATRRFLADASHELRTPIAALQASIETLLREQPERPERDRLEAAALRDSGRLGRLVNDLLGLARLEAHPTRTPVDLATLAQPLVDDARVRAPQASITLHADENAVVSGDPDALERVLRNVIDNALAAIQPSGRIDVQLRRRDGYMQAVVADDGPGVPEHERQRIFERFVRLEPAKPGHGLGLAIAQRIARQHDGDLTCERTPNGASFSLRLPAQP
jgi:two-component system, OmpR family, sensor kinase